MTDDGTYTAVLDRIEVDADDRRLAVLMLEVDGEQVDDLVVPLALLPEAAQETDAVLEVDVEDGELASATHRPAETGRRAEDAQSRFDRLSKRPGDDEE
jgi:ribosomal protein L12E/L44/L45/RPP1/RPP2